MSNLPYPTQPGYPNNAAPPYPPDPNAQPPYGQPPPYAPSAPPVPGQYPPAPYPQGQNQQPYPQGGQNFIKKFFKLRMLSWCDFGLILLSKLPENIINDVTVGVLLSHFSFSHLFVFCMPLFQGKGLYSFFGVIAFHLF